MAAFRRNVLSGTAMGAAVVMAVSLLTAIPAAAAEEPAALTPAGRVVDLPALPSSAAPVKAPRVVTGDFSALLDPGGADLPVAESVARGIDDAELQRRLESLSERDVAGRSDRITTYDLGDGTRMDVISDSIVNVQRGDGSWVESSTQLTKTLAGWTVADHPLSPRFAARADAAKAATYTRGGAEVSFSLDAVGAGTPETGRSEGGGATDTLTFRNVTPGVDLEHMIQTDGVKETLILAEPPAASSWSWTMRITGVAPKLDDHGTVNLVGADGEVVMHIPTPVAWDSSGQEGSHSPLLINPSVSLKETSKGVWQYTVSIDPEWLSDPERVYPVFVDPTLNAGTSYKKSFKSDGAVYVNQAHIGNTRQSSSNVYWRAYTKFGYGSTPTSVIGNAIATVTYDGLGATGSFTGSIRRATAESYTGSTGSSVGSFTLSNGSGSTSGTTFPQFLVDRFKAGDTAPALHFRGSEGSSYSHKRVTIKLAILYWAYPTVSLQTGVDTPTNGSTGASLTPTLRWTGTVSEPAPATKEFQVEVSPHSDMSDPVWQSIWTTATSAVVPEAELQGNTTYYWRVRIRDGADGLLGQETERKSGIWSFTTQTPPPTPPVGSASPGSTTTAQTITTLTPTLQVDAVTDPDNFPSGGTVKYEFKIATGPDGKSGAVVTSPLIEADSNGVVTWQVPEGTLRDGGTYSWVVQPTDGLSKNASPAWVMKLKVDLRLGAGGPSPFDSAGPVSVNLANGNATVNFASPLVQTLGGPMGLSFSYNSQELSNVSHGITAEYFDGRDLLGGIPTNPAGYTFTGKTPVLVRTDPAISFNWKQDEIVPGLSVDHVMARWSGFLTPPAGSYTFGLRHDDGVRLKVNNTLIMDTWGTWSSTVAWAPSATSFSGTATPIYVEYQEKGGHAYLELWVKDSTGNEFIAPPDWFSTQIRTLPVGWTSSTPIAGAGSAYVSAQVMDSGIILTDLTGKAHSWTKTSDGGYTPPDGEYGHLGLDAQGRAVLTDDDGTVYQFGSTGILESATEPADTGKPATPITTSLNGVVTEILDPVSKDGGTYHRKVVFTYANGTGSNCPTLGGSGYATAPPDMLCKIEYPDSSVTELHYNTTGQLAAILDPGDELTTFGYTGGLLSTIRDSVANDWLAATSNPATADTTIQITYTTPTGNEQPKVATVTLPAGDGVTSADRPKKTYTYGTGTTHVDIQGLVVPGGGHAATVTYDEAWRQESATSALGLTATQLWAGDKDLVLKATDPWGRVTTSVYDPYTDRVTASYGPAPEACYTSERVPVSDPKGTSGCGIVPAASIPTYDQGLVGLHATYYANANLSGQPKLQGLGLIGITGGAVDGDWGTSAPATGIPADGWSLRLTGRVVFPDTGIYKIVADSDDGVRVWVDDRLVVDRWTIGSGPTGDVPLNVTAGESQRIRVEYFDHTGTA